HAVEQHVFSAGILGLEAGPQFQDSRQAAVDSDLSLSGLQNAGDELKHGRLAGAVGTQNRRCAALESQIDIAQRPEFAMIAAAIAQKYLFQTIGWTIVNVVALRYMR